MANYTVDWQSSGLPGLNKTPITIPEKTIDSTATSLTLTGKGVANYGEIQQENFIRLMENFASANAPLAPTVGQLWFDTTANVPKVYDVGQVWKALVVQDAGGYITLVGDPINPLHAVTKQYVDALVSGLVPRAPVVAASTAPVTLAGLSTVDGIALAVGDRVLVKDQALPVHNGVYLASNGAWTRSTDFDGAPAGEAVSGMTFPVSGGTINNGKAFSVSTPNPVIVGTSNITFTQSNGGGIGGSNVTLVGNTYIDGVIHEKSNTLTDAIGSRSVDLSLGDYIYANVTGNCSFTFTNAATAARVSAFIMEITDGGTATVTWPVSVQWVTGAAPTLQAIGKNVIGFFTKDGGSTYTAFLVAGAAVSGGGGSTPTTQNIVNVSGTSYSASANDHLLLTNVATTTVTLPAAPAQGDTVYITVMNGLLTNTVNRNGNTIMNIADNITLDISYFSGNFKFLNNTWWRSNSTC